MVPAHSSKFKGSGKESTGTGGGRGRRDGDRRGRDGSRAGGGTSGEAPACSRVFVCCMPVPYAPHPLSQLQIYNQATYYMASLSCKLCKLIAAFHNKNHSEPMLPPVSSRLSPAHRVIHALGRPPPSTSTPTHPPKSLPHTHVKRL